MRLFSLFKVSHKKSIIMSTKTEEKCIISPCIYNTEPAKEEQRSTPISGSENSLLNCDRLEILNTGNLNLHSGLLTCKSTSPVEVMLISF